MGSVGSSSAVETTLLKPHSAMPNLGGSFRFPAGTQPGQFRDSSDSRLNQVASPGIPQAAGGSAAIAPGGDTLLRLPTKLGGSVSVGARAVDPGRLVPSSAGSVVVANARATSPPRVLAPQVGVNLRQQGPCQMNNDVGRGLVNPSPVMLPGNSSSLRPM